MAGESGDGKLAALPNLGPRSAAMLAEIGVTDIEEIRRVGAIDCWRRLRFHHGRRVTLNFLYALDGALCGLDWRHIEPERRAKLRAAASAIVGEMG